MNEERKKKRKRGKERFREIPNPVLLENTSRLPFLMSKSLHSRLWATSGLPRAYLCQRANHCISRSGPTRVYLGPTFANKQILACIPGSRPIRAYLGPTFTNDQALAFQTVGLLGPTLSLPLPTRKSLQSKLWASSGLPRASLWQRGNPCIPGSGPTEADLKPSFAKKQILSFQAASLLGPTLSLHLLTSKSLQSRLWAYSDLPWSLPVPTSKSLHSMLWAYLGLP